MKLISRRLGFTLIELLVVISIIQLLATVIIVNTNAARKNARDAQRIAAIHNMITAIETYYLAHGYWPKMTPAEASTNANKYSSCPTINICEQSRSGAAGPPPSTVDRVTCQSRKPCDCVTAGGTNEKRWLPMLDGSISNADAYFDPEATPRDPLELTCQIPAALPYYYKYDGTYDTVAGSSFNLYYLLEQDNKNAMGANAGCNPQFGCYYIVRGYADGSFK